MLHVLELRFKENATCVIHFLGEKNCKTYFLSMVGFLTFAS